MAFRVSVQWRSSCVYKLVFWSGRWGSVHWTRCLVLQRSLVKLCCSVRYETHAHSLLFITISWQITSATRWTEVCDSLHLNTPVLNTHLLYHDHADDRLHQLNSRMCWKCNYMLEFVENMRVSWTDLSHWPDLFIELEAKNSLKYEVILNKYRINDSSFRPEVDSFPLTACPSIFIPLTQQQLINS